jgi:hypothetical protein
MNIFASIRVVKTSLCFTPYWLKTINLGFAGAMPAVRSISGQ